MLDPAPFTEIGLVRCERGAGKQHQPQDSAAWEASFCLVFSGPPDRTWSDLFDSLRQKYYHLGLLSSFFTARVEGERFTFYCHPLRLQSYVDQIGDIVAETNELYRRRIDQAELWLDPEADFEEMIEVAMANLFLPPVSEIPE